METWGWGEWGRREEGGGGDGGLTQAPMPMRGVSVPWVWVSRRFSWGEKQEGWKDQPKVGGAVGHREKSYLVKSRRTLILEDLGCTVQSIGVLGRRLKPNLDDI